MNLLVVNLSADDGTQVRDAIAALTTRVPEHRVIDAANMRIEPCKGCYTCMLLTPGRCCIQDDAAELLKGWIRYDHIVFIVDTALNYVDHKGKNAIDRLFPLVNITLNYRDGEIVHIPRYDWVPKMAMLFTGNADRELLGQWLSRIAVNVNARPMGVAPITEVTEVCRWMS